MTNNEKALHQILVECLRPYKAVKDYKGLLIQRQYRLDDIQRIAENIIQEIALDKMA